MDNCGQNLIKQDTIQEGRINYEDYVTLCGLIEDEEVLIDSSIKQHCSKLYWSTIWSSTTAK
jgi:hypothetical protein